MSSISTNPKRSEVEQTPPRSIEREDLDETTGKTEQAYHHSEIKLNPLLSDPDARERPFPEVDEKMEPQINPRKRTAFEARCSERQAKRRCEFNWKLVPFEKLCADQPSQHPPVSRTVPFTKEMVVREKSVLPPHQLNLKELATRCHNVLASTNPLMSPNRESRLEFAHHVIKRARNRVRRHHFPRRLEKKSES